MAVSSIDDLLTKDVFGYTCVPEDQLDLAFTMVDKPYHMPQTCLTTNAARTPETLAEVLGRDPTADEWGAYSYRWFRTMEPDRVLFVPVPDPLPPVSSVPLGDSLGFLIGALCCIALWKLWRNVDDLETIR